MDTVFAFREQTAARAVTTNLTGAVTQLAAVQIGSVADTVRKVPNPALADIIAVAERVLTQVRANAVADALEAQKKAQTWSMVGAIIAVVVVIIVAIVVTVFSFGAAGPAMAASIAGTAGVTAKTATQLALAALLRAIVTAVAAIIAALNALVQMLLEAQKLGHPLAGAFASALSDIAAAAQSAIAGDAQAADNALRTILQCLLRIERLTIETSSLRGACLGDPNAVFQCAKETAPLLRRLSDILQTMRILHDADTQALVRVLTSASATVATLTPIVPLR